MRGAAWSLRRRLVVGLVALVVLLTLAIGTASTLALRQSLTDRLEGQVTDLLHGAGGRSDGKGGQSGPAPGNGGAVDPAATTAADPSATGTGTGAASDGGPRQRIGTLVVVESAGTVTRAVYTDASGLDVALSETAVQSLLAATEGRTDHVTLRVDGVGEAIVQRDDRGDGTTVVAGMSTGEVTAAILSLVGIYAVVGLVAVLLAALVGSVLVRRALRPLDRVAATARDVAARSLERGEVRLPERVPERDTDPRTEVGQVGGSLNLLLGHVESALSERQRSESRLRRFVADASHELRTPLASIRGYAELSRREPGRLSETQQRSLERIDAESRRMASLVEDLLLLARLDAAHERGGDAAAGAGASEVVGALERVDLVHVVVDATSDAMAAGREHEWRLELPEDDADDADDAEGASENTGEADAPDRSLEVLGNRDRLLQLVTNLLANARTHTPAGTTVTVGVARSGADAVLRVTDTGHGIDAALLPEIFGRFVRGDASRSREGGGGGAGSGLGLSIAQAIAQAHGGDISVESEAGRTCFEVRLPLA